MCSEFQHKISSPTEDEPYTTTTASLKMTDMGAFTSISTKPIAESITQQKETGTNNTLQFETRGIIELKRNTASNSCCEPNSEQRQPPHLQNFLE